MNCKAYYRKANVVSAVYTNLGSDPAALQVQRFLETQFRRTRLPSAMDRSSLARSRAAPAVKGTLSLRDERWHVFGADLNVRRQLTEAEMNAQFFPISGDTFRFGAFLDDLVEPVDAYAAIDWRSFLAGRARTDRTGGIIAWGDDPLFVQAIDLAYSENAAASAHLVHLRQTCRALRNRIDLDDAARIDLTLCEEVIGSRPRYPDATAAMVAFEDAAMALDSIAKRGGVIWKVVGAGIPLSCFLDPLDSSEQDTFVAVRDTAIAVLRHAVIAPPTVARFAPTSAVGARASALMQRLQPSPDLFVSEPSDLALSSFRRIEDGVIGLLGEDEDSILLVAWPIPRFSIAALEPMQEIVFRPTPPDAILVASEQGNPS